MQHNLNRVIEGIGSRADEFVIFVIPQIDFEPLINLYKKIVRRKIKTILVCQENCNNPIDFTRFKWAQRGTILRTEKLDVGYVISDKTAIWYNERELKTFSKANYFLSRYCSKKYLSNMQDLQRHINSKKGIYDFSNHIYLGNDCRMISMHNKLLFKYMYETESRDYYYATYKMLSDHALKILPKRHWGLEVYRGGDIPSYYNLEKEEYNELYLSFSELGKPYQFELNEKVHF